MSDENTKSEPLLLKSMTSWFPSHHSLLEFLQDLELNSPDRRHLMNYDVAERVASFLTVPKVDPNRIQVVGCSSSDGSHPISDCLSPSEDTWWISGAESMPGGKGSEFVEFQLHPTNIRRLSRVGIHIPPLPQGPLSVRDFVIQAFDGGAWDTISPTWRCENVPEMQYFAFDPPGVDVQLVRVVCLSNQLHKFYTNRLVAFNFNRVGFYSVAFE
jgi:hypothetical protein